MKYPDDVNGDVFRRMEENNFDFSKKHKVEFFAVYATEEEADAVAKYFLKYEKEDQKLVTIETRPYDEGGMELKIENYMLVTYQNVSDFENELQNITNKYEGYLDGWGVLQE
jgi:hypothetical protein